MTSANLPLQKELLAIKERLQDLESLYQQESHDIKKQLQQWEYRLHQQASPAPQEEVPPVVVIAPPATKHESKRSPKEQDIQPPQVVKPIVKAPTAKKEPHELSPAMQMLLHPFQQIGDYARSLYQHYRAEGKLPVFFMTLGGILALLFGFGYLMQMGISLLLDHLSERFFLLI
ncbi:MAG: hypothetical protein AAGM67_14495, partial [Bacteroidota bacterium]